MILSLFGFSVIKHSPKAKYGEKDSFDLLFIVITKRNQDRNEGRTKQWVLNQRAQRNTAAFLSGLHLVTFLIQTLAKPLMYDKTHSQQDIPTSINNKENALQICK